MVFILFSVFGPDFSANDFVSECGLKNVSIWSKGQPLRSGSLHEDSGFSVTLEEAKSTREVTSLIESFLNKNQHWLAALHEHKQPVECLFHLGVTVGEESSFAPCLEFSFSFLRQLVDRKIDLHVSAYPTSEPE